MWAFGAGVFFQGTSCGFLDALDVWGKLCGWLERALGEYCISKDDFEENRSLSYFLLLTFFALCACLCLSLDDLFLFSFF